MPESSAKAISRQNINDINTGGNGRDSEVVKRGRRGTYYRCHSYMRMTKLAGTKVSQRMRVHAAASCRLAIYERYTQEGSSDLADSVMAEIRSTYSALERRRHMKIWPELLGRQLAPPPLATQRQASKHGRHRRFGLSDSLTQLYVLYVQ